MTVVATVGLPGSGKGEAAAVAEELEIPVVTMGDVIRQACRDRGLDPETHHGEVAQQLRAEDGAAAIAERSLPQIRQLLANNEVVLVDGVRSDVEVEVFEEEFDRFRLVSIEAPFDVRRQRLDARDRKEGESLTERDRRERNFGMDAAMEQADIRIDNTGSLAAFRERIEQLLTEACKTA